MIHFAFPWAFALLPLYWFCERRCTPPRPSLPVANLEFLQRAAGRVGSRERWIRRLIVLLIVTALADPVVTRERTLHNARGYSVALLLDASFSMREGQRFATAKRVLADFIRRRPTDRMALEVFGDRARLAAPMSYDKQGLLTILHYLQPGAAGGRDTALYEALFAGAKLFEGEPAKNRLMILLTDGIDTVGNLPLSVALARVKREGIRVYTIGVGDDFRRDVLERIARESGGRFYDASHPEALAKIYAAIDRQEKSPIETLRITRSRHYYRIPLGIAVLLLLLLLGLKIRQRQGIAPVALTLLLSLIALYGPSLSGRPITVRRSGGDLLVALDVSRSMEARDLYPDRFRFALHKFERLLDSMQRMRVGLLLFADRVWLVAPPTGDYAALRKLAEGVDLQRLERGRSDWPALIEAASRLGEEGKARALLIFSDGEGVGDPRRLARQAREKRLRLYGYGTATRTGATIPDGTKLLRNERGDVVVTRLDPAFAEAVRLSGGRFQPARNDDGDLRRLARAIEKEYATETGEEETLRQRTELFGVPLGLALLIFVVPWRKRRGVGSA